MAPCNSMACAAYSEQVGRKRHAAPNHGEMADLYPRSSSRATVLGTCFILGVRFSFLLKLLYDVERSLHLLE